MKTSVRAAVLAACLAPTCLWAASAFDGAWKMDLSKAQLSSKPDVLVIKDGMYHCKTCVPAIDIKADGTDQPVSGHPYFDTLAMTVVDDHTVREVGKKGGRDVLTETTVVSADGKTATSDFSDSSAGNGTPVTGKATMAKVAAGPAGAHALSGSWRTTKYEGVSDNALTMNFKEDGGMLSMDSPMGTSYSARLDGSDAPYKGDPGIDSVAVMKKGKNTIVETDKRQGKVIDVVTMTVQPDGKTMKVGIEDKLHGTHSEFIAMKQ
ncbi:MULTISPECIES: hypothetical protein [Dyella]|uniref:Uncharacterized protein n=2 Tax=Dyella TaxID=231454 RepID=A0A4R0YYJ7_9GAMM|nr:MULTISPECIES: hypothetical protein [Dyella]TBR40310.1 hypothetical protein EYV96_09160 [Dyella terrae]TCI12108.1 hypothetical protein EZM97_01710 [Dyella soli]